MSDSKSFSIHSNVMSTAHVEKLMQNKKYYVQIRTYKKVGNIRINSDWSEIKMVITK